VLSERTRSVVRPLQPGAASRRLQRSIIDRDPEAIGQPRQVVEDPHHVGHLQASLIIESDRSQIVPVLWTDRGGLTTELFRDLA
jgi:hypothetical protein